jgi:xanthine dehydrogenase accessory factor
MLEEFLARAAELRAQERPFVLAIVIRSVAPASGKAGDKAIVQPDGSLWGWIGGGCVRSLVVKEALVALRERKPKLVNILPSEQLAAEPDIVYHRMTCHGGGSIELYLEPVLPRPHLVVFGRSAVARALSALAGDTGYRVTTADASQANTEIASQEDFVVVATQGEDDEGALVGAVRANPRWVAFVASPRKFAAVKLHLAELGLAAEEINRIKAPAGLDLGAISPEEIAITILAELIQVRQRTEFADPVTVAANPVAIEMLDPVCGMNVNPSEARYRSKFAGREYYFCCSGCKQQFDENPGAFVQGRMEPAESSKEVTL